MPRLNSRPVTAVILSCLTFFSTALGGLFALRRRKQLYLVMGFAAGILVSAALLDLLPDAFEIAKQSARSSVRNILLAAALGFLSFYALDRLVHLAAAGHQVARRTAAFGNIAAFGLTVHSFLDGFAIGSAFHASSRIGVLVAIAVIAHDFGDGVSTVAVVLGSRGQLRTSLAWLAADAVAPVVGCAAGLVLAIPDVLVADLLGFFAGSFLFIGAAHLLPEAQSERKSAWLYVAVVAGVAFVMVVTRVLGA